jgi:hypothetical protein
MELTVNKKTAVETANESIQDQIDTLSTKKIERVKSFREYAFEKAGLNRGNYLSLKTHLKWITDGHLVDDSYNENEQQLLKLQVQNKISAKEEEKEKTAGEKRAAEEVTKPFLEKKIKDLNEEIQQTQLDLIDNKVHTGYQPEKYFMWVAFTALLSLYLLFFYSMLPPKIHTIK